jgi:hypothetical protein
MCASRACRLEVPTTVTRGDLENDPAAYPQYGASTNFLTQADVGCESINAMPRMSAIPVNVRPRTAGLSTAGFA